MAELPRQSAALAADWRERADRLDAYAQRCRRDGVVSGPEGAEDAEAAAIDYRRAADELEPCDA